MEFKFEGRTKLITQILMGIGLIALIGGFFLPMDRITTSAGGPTCSSMDSFGFPSLWQRCSFMR